MEDKIQFYKTVIAPYKGELETWYAEKKSLGTYFIMIFLTAVAVISPGNRLYLAFFKDLPPAPETLKQSLGK
jgi:hypothetical protein